jgi:hypothetical protein
MSIDFPRLNCLLDSALILNDSTLTLLFIFILHLRKLGGGGVQRCMEGPGGGCLLASRNGRHSKKCLKKEHKSRNTSAPASKQTSVFQPNMLLTKLINFLLHCDENDNREFSSLLYLHYMHVAQTISTIHNNIQTNNSHVSSLGYYLKLPAHPSHAATLTTYGG